MTGYAAEYWSDGPHVTEFASISALAAWVQLHQLQPTETAPGRFGWYRARRTDGATLSAEERAAVLLPVAPVSIFPREVRESARTFTLLPWGCDDLLGDVQ